MAVTVSFLGGQGGIQTMDLPAGIDLSSYFSQAKPIPLSALGSQFSSYLGSPAGQGWLGSPQGNLWAKQLGQTFGGAGGGGGGGQTFTQPGFFDNLASNVFGGLGALNTANQVSGIAGGPTFGSLFGGSSFGEFLGPALGVAKGAFDFSQGQYGQGAAALAAAALALTPAAPLAPFVALAGSAFGPNMAKQEQHLQFKADIQKAMQEFGALNATSTLFPKFDPSTSPQMLKTLPESTLNQIVGTGLKALQLPFGSAFGRATSGDIPGGTAAIDKAKQGMLNNMFFTFAAQDALANQGKSLAPWGFAPNGVQSIDINTLLSPITTGFGTPIGTPQFNTQQGGSVLGGKLLKSYPTQPGQFVKDLQTILSGQTPSPGKLTWPITLLTSEGELPTLQGTMTGGGLQPPSPPAANPFLIDPNTFWTV